MEHCASWNCPVVLVNCMWVIASVMIDGNSGMPDLLPLLGQDAESIHDWLKSA